MGRNGIDVEIRPEDHFVLFRLSGVVYAKDAIALIRDVFGQLPDPWQYDMLFDARSLINLFVYKDFLALSETWRGIVGNYRPLRFAIVTTDPVRLSRNRTFAAMFDNFEARMFPTTESAAAWLATAVD